MSDDGRTDMPDPGSHPSRHEEKARLHRERHAAELRRREARWTWHGGPWIGGLLLIALGLAFLLRNFGYPLPEHWWALFLLVPAVGAFWSAWTMYEQSGREITSGVRGGLVGGTLLTLLAIVFFFNVDFGKFWPVILIVIGVSVLAGGVRRH